VFCCGGGGDAGHDGRYEVGRFFGAVERLKRAAEEQNGEK